MLNIRNLITRGDSQDMNPTMVDLLISLLVLVLLGLSLVATLLVLRRKRQAREASELPMHNGQVSASHQRRLTITTKRGESVYVIDEKRNLMENSSSPPSSPVPEIRITFPEEEDESGRRKSGRVVVVRIGERGSVGMEPCDEQEDLPPYQSPDNGKFQSLDLERMGGLKEKEDVKRWS